jgi:putative NADPH-quinone reductase
MSEITIVQGHPDPEGRHLCHAMSDAYASGARDGGHSVKIIDVAKISFPLIRSEDDFVNHPPPPDIVDAQAAISESQHIVFVYPLWLGTMPALMKGFLEQVFRYGYALEDRGNGRFRKLLKGRSARIIMTMGMPVVAYRHFFGAHSLKSFERNILKFSGIKPVRESLYGMVDDASDEKRKEWLAELYKLGLEAQ